MALLSPSPRNQQADLSIPRFFARLKDPRRAHRRLHQLQDIIVVALCAVIAGAQDWQQIVTFGRNRLDWLRGFLELPNGIPSHDTFERVFDRLKPQAFQACFQDWVQAISVALRIKHIAIDGKTLRGSGSAKLGPLHLVSAWASAQHLSLGQVAVDAKSNEITAIPALLELLELNGALVTIDAMGCQKAIAQQIVNQGGHYALVVKDNQEHLRDDIQQIFRQAFDSDFAGLDYDTYRTSERGHGREEYRSYVVLHTTEGIRQADAWAKLSTIGLCYSERTVTGKTSAEVRYFIGDKKAGAKYYADGLRHHWGIENNLHWQLDVNFGEDGSRVQKRHAAENLALLRRLTLSLLKAHPSQDSIARKRFAAALDPTFLEEILRGDGILENR
ncbi:MAG TPA: ISAs1 family transposase [Bryobacteraceae bacterium]|jgi:predicted transposase YbfD/YdcC|nr:ISAs1 family transposase [Bryobacteraceae bacterium]